MSTSPTPLVIASDNQNMSKKSTPDRPTSSGNVSPISTQHSSYDNKPVTFRPSFVENMRGVPATTRTHRDSTASLRAVQDLINHFPVAHPDSTAAKFSGRDWRDVPIGDLIVAEDVHFVTADASVEAATKILKDAVPNVVLVRQDVTSRTAIGSFDYDDLIAYLCLVTGIAVPDEASEAQLHTIVDRASRHERVPLDDIRNLVGRKDPPSFLEDTDLLPKAMEIFGSGVHKSFVTKAGTSEVVGVLSQLQLVRFFWEHVHSADALNAKPLKDLGLGESSVISINGDQPLRDALLVIHSKGISSLPVVDNYKNVIGNISHVDVKLLTSTSSLPLLESSCTHFLNVILSERGMMDGQDSYPVFYVTRHTTLAHTVAKLVATRSHRMWVVDTSSPASSVPQSPALKPTTVAPPIPPNQQSLAPTPGPPYTLATPNLAVPAAAAPGAVLSGRLTGVVSLTDILNLYARACGLSPQDPEETRRRRRTSSSNSSMLRVSMDSIRSASVDLSGARKSLDNVRSSADLRRRSSQSKRVG